jgi:hypothetical protein
MAYRGVTMLEVKVVLRLWLAGVREKRIAAQLGPEHQDRAAVPTRRAEPDSSSKTLDPVRTAALRNSSEMRGSDPPKISLDTRLAR